MPSFGWSNYLNCNNNQIETSYLVCRLTTTSPIQKFAKLGQMGTCPGLRDILLHFDFLYPRNGCSY